MAFEKIEITEGRYLWRCSQCGKEYPLKPVPDNLLPSPPPYHECKKHVN